MKRVVITGRGVISPKGNSVAALMEGLKSGTNAVQRMPEWEIYSGLRSLVAAPALLENERAIPRQARRSMGRLALFAVQAAEQAATEAGLDKLFLESGRVGCIAGSTMGSAGSINETFEIMLPERDLSQLPSTKFFQCVSHTAAMNISQYLGITGVVMATSSACASSLQAIGSGYDLIRCGRQEVVICGGAEELHPTVTGSFDVLFATSTGYNDHPELTPRPFDVQRDGLVCGEGGGMVVLEEYEHARARGATIYGEVLGYSTCGNGAHVSQSNAGAMIRCLELLLKESDLSVADVDYISAHATATMHGDVEEATAIRSLFGDRVPVSSLKGHLGHTLGASGAIELIASLEMMAQGVLIPTLNLESVDPACEGIRHVRQVEACALKTMVKNSFAFGGINASLACRLL
jgi:3-oxoacyl-[acyl-carrier-protein] synthase II